MKRLIYILVSGLLLACSGYKIIPDEQLALIFHDAFLSNAYMQHRGMRPDSLNLYEPIFAKYGYTTADVQYTIGNFSKRKSARLSDVVEQAIKLLETEAEHLDRAVPRLLAVAVGVQGDGLHQLVADGVGRVEGGHRILENDRDLVAAHMLHHVLACADELLPVELDGAGDDLARGGEDLHDGIRGHGFAGAGFADDAEHLALVKEEGHAVDGLDLARVGEKGGMEILYFK